jgi:hypothetical protein
MEALCELKIQRNNESREKDKKISDLCRDNRLLQDSKRDDKVFLERKLTEVEKDKKCQKKSIEEVLGERDRAEQARVNAECQVKQYKKKLEYLKSQQVGIKDETNFDRDALCVSRNLESQLKNKDVMIESLLGEVDAKEKKFKTVEKKMSEFIEMYEKRQRDLERQLTSQLLEFERKEGELKSQLQSFGPRKLG